MHILIDTLSMTWQYDNLYSVVKELSLTHVPWEPMRTRWYASGQYYAGVLLAWNTDEAGQITDVFLNLSGTGCRTIEQLNPDFRWHTWLMSYYEEVYARTAHISRIDVAGDDTEEEILDIDLIREYAMQDRFVCKSKVLPDVRYRRTEEVYFGSPKSDRFLRIYNKALERGLPDTHWVRCEFQLRNDNATSFFLNWRKHELGKLYAGMLIDYLRFLDCDEETAKLVRLSCNSRRIATAPWWEKWTSSAEPICQAYLPSSEYTLMHLERYLERQTYSSLKAYLIAHDGDTAKLLEGVQRKQLNQKQREMLAKLPPLKKEDYEEQD